MKKSIILIVALLATMIGFASAAPSEDEVTRLLDAIGPFVWEIDRKSEDFVPQRGGIKVCKDQNSVTVGFYLSDVNMRFYSQMFKDGDRKDIGFEIDVIDHSGVFNREEDLVSIDASEFSRVRYYDNHMGDGTNEYSIGINDPTQLKVGEWYRATFYFDKHKDISQATFEVRIQLVGNVHKLMNEYLLKYLKYGPAVPFFDGWFLTAEYNDGSNFFGIRKTKAQFWADKFFLAPEDGGYDRYLWLEGDNKKRSCGIGQVCDYEPIIAVLEMIRLKRSSVITTVQ